MKKNFLITGLFATSVLALAGTQLIKVHSSESKRVPMERIEPVEQPTETSNAENTIQVALLLDTSSSMDGLIEQAKSRLWNIVNTLTTLKYNGKTPKIEIALYEYGNDGISDKNWIRKIAPLTQDLDLISEKLFALRTNGGTEYCGAVIQDATKQLDWNSNSESMKLVYIAGNEPFNQQGVNYKEAISEARRKNIYVNTIYCGDYESGVRTFWQDGAKLGNGNYFNIDSNKKVLFVPTPYDDRIADYNVKLNGTYVSYGAIGYEKKAMQNAQDVNAERLSKSNAVERTVSKTKKSAYRNDSWDLIDKAESDKEYINKIKNEDLPLELKGKSKAEIAKYVETKSKERADLQKQISELAVQRQKYIDEELKKRGNSDSDDLGKAMEKSIYDLAKVNGFSKE